MQAFKLYYKILFRRLIITIIIYVGIFSAMTIAFSTYGGNQYEGVFELSKCSVAVINNDNSELSNNLEAYINEKSKPVKIKNDIDSYKDALFFRECEYIAIIPEGFEESFKAGNALSIETMAIPDSASGTFISQMIDGYLNTAKFYLSVDTNASIKSITENVILDLSNNAKVTLTETTKKETGSKTQSFFNFLPYPVMCILIIVVSNIMMVFNLTDIKRRNQCSPLKYGKFNIQLLLGNGTLAIALWVVFITMSIVMYKGDMLNTSGVVYMMNAFVFMLVSLSLSFLISTVATKKSIDPICNSLSLGLCFIGGSFVPQSMLSESVKNMAVINPVFWFVKANNSIGSLSTFNFDTMKPIILDMGIQICFSLALVAISLVIIKQKRTSN